MTSENDYMITRSGRKYLKNNTSNKRNNLWIFSDAKLTRNANINYSNVYSTLKKTLIIWFIGLLLPVENINILYTSGASLLGTILYYNNNNKLNLYCSSLTLGLSQQYLFNRLHLDNYIYIVMFIYVVYLSGLIAKKTFKQKLNLYDYTTLLTLSSIEFTILIKFFNYRPLLFLINILSYLCFSCCLHFDIRRMINDHITTRTINSNRVLNIFYDIVGIYISSLFYALM